MEEVVGRNPRFMQDPQADQGAVMEMRQAISEGRATVVEVVNVRKDGSRFWNQVSLLATRSCCACSQAMLSFQSCALRHMYLLM